MRHLQTNALTTLFAGLLLAGCVREATPPEGPLSIRVTFDAGAGDDVGADDPLPFSHDPSTFTVDLEVLDIDGTVMTGFDGELGVRSRPG